MTKTSTTQTPADNDPFRHVGDIGEMDFLMAITAGIPAACKMCEQQPATEDVTIPELTAKFCLTCATMLRAFL